MATAPTKTRPAARTPIALTAVSRTTQPMATGTISPGPPNCGPANDSADAAPTATDACAVQLETQNAHATRNAMVGPNSRSTLAWMPSPPRRDNLREREHDAQHTYAAD